MIEQVYDRTGGVPLFVEEFTKMVQESGVLERAGDDGSHAPALPAHEIPATLQDLVMARLDRMEGDRELAQLAAVLGREFSHELLAAVATVDEPTLQAELAKLAQAEILYPKGRPPRCTYIFKHALLEDALYNALVKGKRQQFHRRIAEVLEAQFPQTAETQPELLAHHFTEAGLTEKAVGYWLKAGLRSRERSADCEAIGHLTKGLALLETLEESRGARRQELQFLTTLAPPTSRPAVTPRPKSGRSCSAPANCANGSGTAAAVRDHVGHVGVAHRARRPAGVRGPGCRRDDAGRRPERPRHADGSAVHAGRHDVLPCRVRGCPCLLREARSATTTTASARSSGPPITGHDAGVTHRCYLALALWHLGYPDQALKMAARCVSWPARSATRSASAMPWTSRRFSTITAGSEPRSRRAAEEEMAIATEQGFPFWHALGTLHKGAGMLLQGRREEALPLLLKGFRPSGPPGRKCAFRPTSACWAMPTRRPGASRTRTACWTKGWRSPRRTTTVATRPSCTASRASCCWPSRPTESAARRGVLPPGHRDGPAPAEQGVGAAGHDESRPALAAAGPPRRGPRRAGGRLRHYTEGFTTPDLVDARVLLGKSGRRARTQKSVGGPDGAFQIPTNPPNRPGDADALLRHGFRRRRTGPQGVSTSLHPGLVRLPVVDKQDIRFTQLSAGGELLQVRIQGITQDNYGFMWFGTNAGLYRYDGYSLKSYQHDPNDPNSLSDDTIRVRLQRSGWHSLDRQ